MSLEEVGAWVGESVFFFLFYLGECGWVDG